MRIVSIGDLAEIECGQAAFKRLRRLFHPFRIVTMFWPSFVNL
jgi:hypothetical protein